MGKHIISRNKIFISVYILAAVFMLAGCGVDSPADGTNNVPADSPSSITSMIELLPGDPSCPYGGHRIFYGIDENQNGLLDEDEQDGYNDICNGADGFNIIQDTTVEPPGDNCATGGIKVDSGLDLNRNDILEAEEIIDTIYVCDGISGTDGTDGTDGYNILQKTAEELPGENCPAGGIKIESGLDLDRSNILEAEEVTATEYICNGTNSIRPAVIANTPMQGATGVPVNQNISVAFTHDMNAGTVNSTTFQLYNDTLSQPVTGAVTYSNKLAVFTPAELLAEGSQFTARITTGAADTNGFTLATEFTWTFSTGSTLDGPPIVTGTNPTDGTGNVGIVPQIKVSFSQDMNSGTIDAASFTLVDDLGEPVTGLIYYADKAATFVPATPLKESTTYTANVAETVANFQGMTMVAPYTFSFTTGSRFWRGAELAETQTGVDAFGPEVGIDQAGKVHIIWRQNAASPYDAAVANRDPATGTWSDMLIEWGAGNVNSVKMAVAPTGDAYAGWEQVDIDSAGLSDIGVKHFDPASGWEVDPTITSQNGTNSAVNPDLAVNSSGQLLLGFNESGNIYGRLFTPGVGWGAISGTADGSTATDQFPAVTLDDSSNGGVIWLQTSHLNVFWRDYSGSGNDWGTKPQFNGGQAPIKYADADSNPDGNVIAAYQVNSAGATGSADLIKANVRIGGTWSGVTILADVTDYVGQPHVAIDDLSNAIAVWAAHDGNRMRINAIRYDAVNGWDKDEFDVLQPTVIDAGIGTATQVHIDMDKHGNALATWIELDVSGIPSVFARRYRMGTGWDAAVSLLESGNGEASAPRVAMNPEGEAVVAWSQMELDEFEAQINTNIYANMFK